MEYAGLEQLDGAPKKITSSDPKDLERIIGCFVDEYVMLEFDVEKALRQQKEQALQQPQAEAAATEPRFLAITHLLSKYRIEYFCNLQLSCVFICIILLIIS